jgi:miniconductance mechanosensitive channel
LIKASSIRFFNNDELKELKKITLISAYLDTRMSVDSYNMNNDIDKSLAINGRNITNLGLFRKYVTHLNNHPGINQNLLLCRQLQSTSEGVPLEVYAFTSDKEWQNYEYIMSDIFDHIIAAVPYFGLELYELRSNSEFIKQT